MNTKLTSTEIELGNRLAAEMATYPKAALWYALLKYERDQKCEKQSKHT